MEKKCPFCAELIKADAVLCKHCNKPLSAAPVVVEVVRPAPEVVITTTTVTD